MPVASHPILSQHFSSSEFAFAAIDQEIAAIRESMRVLHAFRNTFTPTYRLPPEILARIFLFFRQLFPTRSHYAGKSSPRWIRVSHVSQHWRKVAISTPRLWSYVSSRYCHGMLEEWLRRSRAAPLSIDIDSRTSQEALQVVGPSLSRVQQLSLWLPEDMWTALSPQLSSSAPLLESLSVKVFTSADSDDENAIQLVPTMPDTVFAGTTPLLRSLEVCGCSIDVNSSIFRDLTALQLGRQTFSATELLTMLRRLPRLTSLTLSHVLRPDTPSISPDFHVVSLSSLKSLHIHGRSFIQDLDLLAHISFPAKTILRFHSTVTHGQKDLELALIQFLSVQDTSRQLDLTSASPFRFMQLDYRTHGFCLQFTPKDSDSVVIMRVELYASFKLMVLSDRPEVRTLCSYFPLQSLVSFSTDCKIDAGIWTSVFGALLHLKKIYVSGQLSGNILDAFINDFKTVCPSADANSDQDVGVAQREVDGGGIRQETGPQVAPLSFQVSAAVEPNLRKLGRTSLA